MAYTIYPQPEEAIREQRASYAALLQRLGPATAGEIEQALAGRERVEPEAGLGPEVVEALRRRVAREGAGARPAPTEGS